MKIQIDNQHKRIKIDKRNIRDAMRRLLKMLDCENKEISVTFVDDAAIRLINKQYLSKDKPTNVISFSLREGEFGNVNPDMLGDIIISADTAAADADKGQLSFDEEIFFLMIHGLLHLMGYNHENTSKSNALIMRKKEKELFRLLTQSDII